MLGTEQLIRMNQTAFAYVSNALNIEKSIFEDDIIRFTDDPDYHIRLHLMSEPMMSSMILGIELYMKLLHYLNGGNIAGKHILTEIYDILEQNIKSKLDDCYNQCVQDFYYLPIGNLPPINPQMADGKYHAQTIIFNAHAGSSIPFSIEVRSDKIPTQENERRNFFYQVKYLFEYSNDFKQTREFFKILDDFRLWDRYRNFERDPNNRVIIRPSATIITEFMRKICSIIDAEIMIRYNEYTNNAK